MTKVLEKKMDKIFIPSTDAEEWSKLVADEKHWKTGYSAKATAYSWQEANDFPKSIRRVYEKFGEPFSGCESLLIFPEHKVPLPGGVRPSQNDVWVLAKSGNDLISIAVEGKKSEPFGRTIKKWFEESKRERLNYLCNILGLSQPIDEGIRYQLLHRSASAVIEAKRFTAKHAMMMVHSFSQENEHFDDYLKFLSLFKTRGQIAVDEVVSAGIVNGISLYFAWVKGNPKYLEK